MKKQWISVKCGLSRDPKHRRQMGKAVWTFLHMLDLADWETGIVYDWKDENAAEDMGIDIRVLREDRRKLDEEGYISCRQKQYGQDITIHNWTNPREYTGEVYNKKQGDGKLPPSKNAQGDAQGDAQGSIKDVTPTYSSKNQISNNNTGAKRKTEKAEVPPAVKVYREVTKRYPKEINYQTVIDYFLRISLATGEDVTAEYLRPFYAEWTSRGYNPQSLKWLEWAVTGRTPAQGVQPAKANNRDKVAEQLQKIINGED